MNDQNESHSPEKAVASDALFGILRYVANECQKYPGDSVKDIVNEAMDNYGLPFYAE